MSCMNQREEEGGAPFTRGLQMLSFGMFSYTESEWLDVTYTSIPIGVQFVDLNLEQNAVVLWKSAHLQKNNPIFWLNTFSMPTSLVWF